jgi:hypothetical protein
MATTRRTYAIDLRPGTRLVTSDGRRGMIETARTSELTGITTARMTDGTTLTLGPGATVDTFTLMGDTPTHETATTTTTTTEGNAR